jgi:hypothetical protein
MKGMISGMGTQRSDMENYTLYDQIYQFVRQIPRGKVVSIVLVDEVEDWWIDVPYEDVRRFNNPEKAMSSFLIL